MLLRGIQSPLKHRECTPVCPECVPSLGWCVESSQDSLQHPAHCHCVVYAGQDDTPSSIQQHHEGSVVQQLVMQTAPQHTQHTHDTEGRQAGSRREPRKPTRVWGRKGRQARGIGHTKDEAAKPRCRQHPNCLLPSAICSQPPLASHTTAPPPPPQTLTPSPAAAPRPVPPSLHLAHRPGPPPGCHQQPPAVQAVPPAPHPSQPP